MINSKKKRFLSAFMILAVAATATLGGLSAVSSSAMRSPVANADDTTIVNKTSVEDATKYYIGTTAETGSGTSPEDPMPIGQAASIFQNLQPGDIVYIMPGVWEPAATWALGRLSDSELTGSYVNGAYDDYIIFTAYNPAEETVLDFSSMNFASTNRGVHIYGNYYYWSNIDICGAGDNGLYIGGSYNVVENCEFYNNRDTGLQLGRNYSSDSTIDSWPNYNLIKNCTSHNNYDNETKGENADGFAAKLTVGYHNVFDGCVAYRNSDDGWDLYGKEDTGIIGTVYMYNCVAFENGFLEYTQEECNAVYGEHVNTGALEANPVSYTTQNGDGNGFKLGGSTLEGDVYMYNCYAFNNRMHGITDNSNPGVISLTNVISYNNSAEIDNRPYTVIVDENGNSNASTNNNPYSVYHHLDEEGYILNVAGNRIIVTKEGGAISEDYVSLDSEGYILDEDGERVMTEATDTAAAAPIEGVYVKADTAQTVENSNFGQISGWSTEHNNIDLARSESSYNNMTGVLSVYNGRNGTDAYIASAENSLLAAGSGKWNRIEGVMDANTVLATGSVGESVNSVAASDIFVELPANNLGISGTDFHTAWRNDDGSLNLGKILKIKDYAALGFEEGEIGANLSLTSQSEYPAPEYTFMTDDAFTSEAQAVAQAFKNVIYAPVKADAVYQDFDLATSFYNNVTVTWTSSDSSIISIATEVQSSISGVKQVRATVNRNIEKDETVTLTATATVGGVDVVKTFELTVKQNEYIVGDIIVDGVNTSTNTLSTTQYLIFDEPEITVLNAADYNGKVLPETAYEVRTTYMYAPSKGAHSVEVPHFTTSNSGVYTITKEVSLKDSESVGSYTYTLYVVDQYADVDFVNNTASVSVGYNSFVISGDMTGISGSIYAMVSDSQPSANDLKVLGQRYDFSTDSVTATFEADNDGAYTIYYVVCNPAGFATSEVYSAQIAVNEISTVADLQELISSGGETNVINMLTADIDLSSYDGTWNNGDSSGFVGYLDGNGYTISNLTVSATADAEGSFIQRLYGGTITNVTFKDFDIRSTGKKVGIFGESYSGNIVNVKLENVYISGAEYVGLIGQVYEANGSLPLVIDRVAIINDDEHGIFTGARRAGGIIGLIQPNSTPRSNTLDIRISNCYVDSLIGAEAALTGEAETYATSIQHIGGVVGSYDHGSGGSLIENYSMSIDHCYFVGTIAGGNQLGGIIGYQNNTRPLTITNCVSLGTIYYQDATTPLSSPEKNASGIFGGYNSSELTIVRGCFSNIEEHNTSFGVLTVTTSQLETESFWSLSAEFDLENIWVFDATSEHYISLR